MKSSFMKTMKRAAVVLGTVAAAAMARPYMVGVDVSWVLEDESLGATYYHDGKKMDLFDILADHGVNFIRVRTFVNSCIGYAKESYSGANSNVCWCDLDHTIQLAKRIKAHNMGFFLDFHMSDTWASIGHQNVPASWAGKSNAEMGKLAYQHVKTTMDALVAEGLKPDMVQVGNEINSKVAGVSMSKTADFANIINSGVKAVREIDPNIKIVMQHGQPRPDKGFADWYKKIHENIDYDAICGSTYGTTNNGNDWREMFGLVTKNKKPVLSCEYTGQRTNLVNTVFSEFGDLGWGTFVWEPTRYSEKPMFDRSGQKYTANARLDELAAFAKKIGATLPDWVGSGKKIPKVFVKAIAGIGGIIERSVAGDSVAQGSSLTFTANPLNGWEFVGWKGDATGNNKEFKVEKLEKGVDVSADFRFVGKDSLKYEAENAVLKETVLEAKHEGFSGEGYANLDNSRTSSVTIPVCLPQDVKQEMEIVFANGGTASRPVSISVNGEVQVDRLELESTGEWTSWMRKSVLLTVPAGVSDITIASLTDDGAPNIDVIRFQKIGSDANVGDKDVGGKDVGGKGTEALNRGIANTESGLQKPFRTFYVNGRAVRSGEANRVANRRHLIRVSK